MNEGLLSLAMSAIAIGGAASIWIFAPHTSEDDYNVDAELNRALIEVIIRSSNCSQNNHSSTDGPSSTVRNSQVRENTLQ